MSVMATARLKISVPVSGVALVAVYLASCLPNEDEPGLASEGSTPTFIREWGSEGTGDGQFRDPKLLAVDPSDNVYVPDRLNDIDRFRAAHSLGARAAGIRAKAQDL